MFVYRQQYNENIYTGIICAVDIEEYKSGKIKKHEKTIYKREKLFADYISVTKIHAEPVLLTYNENINLINTNHTKKKTYYLTFCLMMGSITQFGELVIQKKLIKLLIWQKKLKAFT